MTRQALPFTFIGSGDHAALQSRLGEITPWQGTIGPWRRRRGDAGIPDDRTDPDHPANYRASAELVAAVNTAVLLAKPLLLTGSPGTGKSQLAERIAWELNLGPVLRFEAQSLSEAPDLFYRFDLVGHLAAVEMYKSAWKRASEDELTEQLTQQPAPEPQRFVKLGALGEAIVRSAPGKYSTLFDAVFGPDERAATTVPRPSVVLIDEIDKASRDFPNDLLNGIERMEFQIRELGLAPMVVDEAQRPIVVITSNSERDLPAPFLRRCTFFHIADPTEDQLREIIWQRFFAPPAGSVDGSPDGRPPLPDMYAKLLETFWNFREQHKHGLRYSPGTSELIDWTAALRRRNVPGNADFLATLDEVRNAASSVSKHRDDHDTLRLYLDGLKPKKV